MLKKTKKLALNFKILRFFLIPTILVSTPFFNKLQDAKAGLEFQWDQDDTYTVSYTHLTLPTICSV